MCIVIYMCTFIVMVGGQSGVPGGRRRAASICIAMYKSMCTDIVIVKHAYCYCYCCYDCYYCYYYY